MTPKQYIEEREEEFNQFKCIQSGCDNNGTVPDGNGEATACKFCHEFLMPIKEYHSQTIKGLIEVIVGEAAELQLKRLTSEERQRYIKDHLWKEEQSRRNGHNQALSDITTKLKTIIE